MEHDGALVDSRMGRTRPEKASAARDEAPTWLAELFRDAWAEKTMHTETSKEGDLSWSRRAKSPLSTRMGSARLVDAVRVADEPGMRRAARPTAPRQEYPGGSAGLRGG